LQYHAIYIVAKIIEARFDTHADKLICFNSFFHNSCYENLKWLFFKLQAISKFVLWSSFENYCQVIHNMNEICYLNRMYLIAIDNKMFKELM